MRYEYIFRVVKEKINTEKIVFLLLINIFIPADKIKNETQACIPLNAYAT